MTSPLIDIRNLSVEFTTDGELIIAVDGISFSCGKGQTTGIVGESGSGKSVTNLSILRLIPSPPGKIISGKVLLDGTAFPGNNGNRRAEIGFVPQVTALYPELSAIDNLKFWGGLYGLKGAALKERIDTVLRIVELSRRGKDKVETYAEGMKKRINMAAGILHDPKVVFMDEPTAGVDPQGRYAILGIVRELAAAGKTIIYTTHYMDEAERSPAIAILDLGRLVAAGTPAALAADIHAQVLVIGSDTPRKVSKLLAREDFVHSTAQIGNSLRVLVDRDLADPAPRAAAVIRSAGLHLDTCERVAPNLEDVFVTATQERMAQREPVE